MLLLNNTMSRLFVIVKTIADENHWEKGLEYSDTIKSLQIPAVIFKVLSRDSK